MISFPAFHASWFFPTSPPIQTHPLSVNLRTPLRMRKWISVLDPSFHHTLLLLLG